MSTHMFDNYENITGQPDNIHEKVVDQFVEYDSSNVKEIRNNDGILTGYKWKYGEDVSIALTVDIPILIKEIDLTSSVSGDAPTTSTVGTLGSRYYNLVDMYSWLLTSISNSVYTWVKDDKLTYSLTSPKTVLLTPSTVGLEMEVDITNFRGEQILTKLFSGNSFTFSLTSLESKKLPGGIYKMEVYSQTLESQGLIVNNPLCKCINKFDIYIE